MIKSKDINRALKVLNLKKSGNLSELEKAFRKLAVKYHPDRCKGKKKISCRKRFVEINNARKILEDYYTNRYRPRNNKDVIRKTRIYKKHIKEYKEHMKRFYDDWFGGIDV